MGSTASRRGARSSAPAAEPSLAPAVAAATVFVASGAVLVLEILAVRLLAPYVGLTLETTTSIIGAALAGIAAGAAIGGRVADATEPRRLAVGLLVAGGLLALLTVPIVRALGPGARGKGDLAALGITLLALVPSAAVLSAVSPTIARLQLRDLRASGTVVGRLSAWATAGALVGTFGTGFVLVPLMPVSTAVLATGAVLILAGLALGIHSRALRAGAAATAAAAAVALALLSATRDSPCDVETSYHCAAVVADPARPSGRHLMLDDIRHSYVDLEDPSHLEYGYVQWIGHGVDRVFGADEPLDAVFVGGGGFTLPRWLLATRPGSTAHVLEVDEQLVELDRERLGLRTSPELRVTTGDARMTLRDVPTDSADLVVGDAFGTYAVPWHLATREWAQEIRRVLRPGGLYALNVIDAGPAELLRAETATLLPLFEDVGLVAASGGGGEPDDGNAVLFASDARLPERLNRPGSASWTRAELAQWSEGASELRDDHAPVDQLLTADF